MQKNVINMLLIFGLVAVKSLPVLAEDIDYSCGEDCAWRYDENTKTITIYGTGDNGRGTMENKGAWNSQPWQNFMQTVEHVVVEDGITNFAGSFVKANKLQDVIMPNSVTQIQSTPFQSSRNLKYVKLPENLTSIPEGLFRDTGVEEIILPSTVTSIGTNAFLTAQQLKSIVLPDTLKSIGHQAFYNTTNLESITIPENVTSINANAFVNSGLTEVFCSESQISSGICTSAKFNNAEVGYYTHKYGEYRYYKNNALIKVIPDHEVKKIYTLEEAEAVTAHGDKFYVRLTFK